MIGKVYFISAPGRIKIGYTRQPEKRLRQLQASDMEKLESLGTIAGTRRIEAMLHGLLSAYRLRGEWFLDCAEVRSTINDALGGRLKFEADDEVGPSASSPSIQNPRVDVAMNAIQRSRQICSEIEARIARKEDVKDLVQMATFLAEGIIAPILRGQDSP